MQPDPSGQATVVHLDNIEEGCEPNISYTEEYGYLVSTSMPIRTDDGEIVGYATVDLSMNEITDHKQNLLFTSLALFAIVTILVCLIVALAADRVIVRPINKLSETAKNYTANGSNFSELEIRTGDEIELLAESMKRLEKDVREYYGNLLATRSDLETTREQAKEYKREANIDPLTGVQNKRAYDLAAAKLDDGNTPYAIVMVDLNDLKMTNDRYGHDKGDVAIKKLTEVLRGVFENSPVYRIGGDEFTVILTGENLGSMGALLDGFRAEMEKIAGNASLPPWERISAACGSAVYDGQLDSNVAGVFKRADDDMYQRKAAAKEISSAR